MIDEQDEHLASFSPYKAPIQITSSGSSSIRKAAAAKTSQIELQEREALQFLCHKDLDGNTLQHPVRPKKRPIRAFRDITFTDDEGRPHDDGSTRYEYLTFNDHNPIDEEGSTETNFQVYILIFLHIFPIF